jgi:bacillithiol biosynthesis cysteine-adding enzyme BshC
MIRIERQPFRGSALAEAYVGDFASIAPLYRGGPPDDIESYRRVARAIRDRWDGSRWQSLLAAPLASQPVARERLQEVANGRGFFVSTGQQAGLFVSPLYTLYKALTAARLAAQLEERLGMPVMPLFSVASEDHDWGEVDHTYIVDRENELVRLSVRGSAEGEDAPTPPVERIRLGADVEVALDSLAQSTADSEDKLAVLTALRAAYRPDQGFAQAFESALSHLLRDHAYLIARTAHPWVKRQTAGALWAEWRQRERSEAALLARAQELAAAGFEPQVPVVRGTTSLFVEGRLGRDRILWEGSTARLRRSDERLSEEQLEHILATEPDRVSPGALLRPVMEACAFPVVAYVGGPGEIAYLAQSQVLFELHGIPAPVVVPRGSFVLIEPRVARVLEKYGIAAGDLAGDASAAVSRLVREQTPPGLQDALRGLREAVAAALKQVEKAAIEFDSGAQSALGSGTQAVLKGIGELEKRVLARVKDKHRVMQAQLGKAALNLFPTGLPQERVLSPYPFLMRYGEALLERIFSEIVTPLS